MIIIIFTTCFHCKHQNTSGDGDNDNDDDDDEDVMMITVFIQ